LRYRPDKQTDRLTDRQTDRQTNAGENLTLATAVGVGKNLAIANSKSVQ